MADIAWFQADALYEDATRRPSGQPVNPPSIQRTAIQEGTLERFRAFEDPTDWRVRDFGIQSELTFTSGNILFVQQTYADLDRIVKLKK